jgi:hypothetical protein
MTVGALVAGFGDNTGTLGWIVLGVETVLFAGALAILEPRWFWKPPPHVPTSVLTGMFLRLAIAEAVFVTGFVMLFLDWGGGPMLAAGLAASIILVWIFVAPTRRRIEILQDQVQRFGGLPDVAAELAAPRLVKERPLR